VVREFASELADAIAVAADGGLVGVYLHGSAVLGDWSASSSDVDVLVVVEDGLSTIAAERLAAVLRADRSGPGTGLEASVVEAGAASEPRAPWPFVIHATTTRDDRKVVWGTRDGGDSDLTLHYAVAREFGWPAYGPDARSVVGSIPERIIAEKLAEELRWAVDHAGVSYAVLNACRALRYRDERTLCSKTDAAHWARARGIRPALVQEALDVRRRGSDALPMTDAVAEWVLTVATDIT
jgi:Domain of unknown function (DUF4111)/Nucleotidyltransferase domain